MPLISEPPIMRQLHNCETPWTAVQVIVPQMVKWVPAGDVGSLWLCDICGTCWRVIEEVRAPNGTYVSTGPRWLRLGRFSSWFIRTFHGGK